MLCIYNANASFKAILYDTVGKISPKHTTRGACLLYANILFCPEWSSGWIQTSTIFPCLNEVRDYMISGDYFDFISRRWDFFTYLKLTIAFSIVLILPTCVRRHQIFPKWRLKWMWRHEQGKITEKYRGKTMLLKEVYIQRNTNYTITML